MKTIKKALIVLLLIIPIPFLTNCRVIGDKDNWPDPYELQDDKVYYYTNDSLKRRHSIYVGPGNGGKIIPAPSGSYDTDDDTDGELDWFYPEAD